MTKLIGKRYAVSFFAQINNLKLPKIRFFTVKAYNVYLENSAS